MTPIQRRIRRSNTPIFSSLLSHLLYCFPPTGTHWKPEGEEIWLMQSTGVRPLGSELIMEGRQWVGGGMWAGSRGEVDWWWQHTEIINTITKGFQNVALCWTSMPGIKEMRVLTSEWNLFEQCFLEWLSLEHTGKHCNTQPSLWFWRLTMNSALLVAVGRSALMRLFDTLIFPFHVSTDLCLPAVLLTEPYRTPAQGHASLEKLYSEAASCLSSFTSLILLGVPVS